MKSKPKKQIDESTQLMALIKAGTLEVNQRNAERVKDAWIDALQWDELFRKSGLQWLPDPEGLSEAPQVFEEWLVVAYAGNFKSADEARAALHTVRDEVIASVD
jgi:hypothetical protein